MPDIRLRGVSKSYGGGYAVADLDLTIREGEFVCLLGPSGCGKTTTLRMIAGLEHPTAGDILHGDRVLDSVAQGRFVPPEKREMGLVFQNYALWPHLTVRKNIEFGLNVRKVPRAQRRERVDELLTLLQIEGVGDRYPSQLSGGQQQRVALARMLAINPSVLLLDEPLSNLDARLRLEMRAELKRLHQRLGNTIIFVTHDQLEAMTMATMVTVMHQGRAQQIAPPLEIYQRPANLFVAEFVGTPPMNLFRANDPATQPVHESLSDRLRMIGEADGVPTFGIRPEALTIVRVGEDAWWAFPARVEAVMPTGAEWIVHLRLREAAVAVLAPRDPGVQPGETVAVTAAPGDLHRFDADGLRLTTTTVDAGERLVH